MCLALLFRLLQSTSRLSLFPYTTLFRSAESSALGGRPSRRAVSFPDSRAVRATRPARRSGEDHRNAAPDVSLELLASRGRKPLDGTGVLQELTIRQIGRASCRERVKVSTLTVAVEIKERDTWT